ncbi:MAG: hypothetical protein V4501_10655 [Pseudomonadota bacterium]
MLSGNYKEKLLPDSIELMEVEEKKHESAAELAVVTPPSLRFLHNFSETEISDLEKQYDRTRYQLDAAVSEYFGLFMSERIQNWFACGSGGLIIAFIISTSNEAFINLVKLIPGATIPNAAANSISVPIAVISTGLFVVAFSCQKEAVKTVLGYFYRKPIKIRTWEEWQRAQRMPLQVALDNSQFLLNWSIMKLTNVTAALPLLINFTDQIGEFQKPLDSLAYGSILYFGERFFAKYLNAPYLKGLMFFQQYWRGERKHLGVTGTLETVLQAASSTTLRIYPYYVWLALGANEALGWWPSPYLVGLFAAVHSVALFYPSAFNYYFADQEQVEKLLLEKFQHLPEAERETAIDAERALLVQQVMEEFGRFFLFKKSKVVIPVLAYDTFIGGYGGYELGRLFLVDSVAFPVVGSVLLASLFGGVLYKAEATRVLNKLSRDILEVKPEVVAPISVNEKLGEVAGNAINIATAASIVTSIISTGSNLAENIPLLKSAIYLGAGKRGLNIFQFNREMIVNTMRGLVPAGNVFKETWACFFKKAEREVVAVPTENHSLRQQNGR